MAYTDEVGEWETLGTIVTTTEWQQFPNVIQGDPDTHREVFKLTYACDWTKRIRRYASYGLIRFDFDNGASAGPFKIWPYPEVKMTDFPIPQEVLDIVGIEYHASIRKVNRSQYELPDLDAPWSLTLDYFTGPSTPP